MLPVRGLVLQPSRDTVFPRPSVWVPFQVLFPIQTVPLSERLEWEPGPTSYSEFQPWDPIISSQHLHYLNLCCHFPGLLLTLPAAGFLHHPFG